jgi:hypothetical protein
MLHDLPHHLIAHIGTFLKSNDCKQCIQASKIFSSIFENKKQHIFIFNDKKYDYDLKLDIIFKLKPILEKITINIESSKIDITKLSELINILQKYNIKNSIDIYKNQEIFFECIHANIYINYCDYRLDYYTRDQLDILSSIKPSNISELVLNLSRFCEYNLVNLNNINELILFDNHGVNYGEHIKLIRNATCLYINGNFNLNILTEALKLKTLVFGSMNFFDMLTSNRFFELVVLLKYNKKINKLKFYSRTLQDPHIIPFVNLLVEYIPEIEIKIGQDAEYTLSQQICVNLIKYKIIKNKNIIIEENEYNMYSYDQLLDKLSIIDVGTYRLWCNY